MGRSHAIDDLVQTIASPKEKSPQTQGRYRVVAYDKKERRAIDPPSLTLFRKLTFFRINFETIAEQEVGPIVVRDTGAGKSAGIIIGYRARCEEDRERRLIEKIAENPEPGSVIDGRIEDIIKRAVGEKNSLSTPFLLNFDSWCSDISARISSELRDFGLYAQVAVKLHQRYSDEPLLIRDRQMDTRLKDVAEYIRILLDARIEVDPGQRVAFLLAAESPQQIEEQLAKWTTDFFSLRVTLSALDITKARVEADLTNYLQERLRPLGRTLVQLDFRYELPFRHPDRQTDFIHRTSCLIDGRPQPVTVEHKVLVSLKDLGRLKASGVVEPLLGLRKAIDEATQAAVFRKSYVELIKAFNQPAARGEGGENKVIQGIKGRVQEYAETIGYAVEQLLAIPDEKPNLLQRDGVRCELGRTDYGLQDPRIEGRVHIQVVAQLPDLEKIEAYLQPNVDIEKEIIRQAERQVQQVLLKTTCHRFHTEFVAAGNGHMSVVDELTQAIESRLASEFKLEHIETSIRMGLTRLAERFQNLARGQHETEVRFLAGVGEMGERARGEFGAEDMQFTVRYAIDGIDGVLPESWYHFQSRDYQNKEDELAAIEAVLRDELTMMLNQLPVVSLRSTEFQTDFLQTRLKQRLKQKIVEDFGIAISVSTVVRRENAADVVQRQAAELHRQFAIDQLQQAWKERTEAANKMIEMYKGLFDKYEQLLAKRTNVALSDPGDFRLVEYDEQISQIHKQLSHFEERLKPAGSYAEMIASPRSAPRPPSPEQLSVDDHLKRLGGPDNGDQERTEGESASSSSSNSSGDHGTPFAEAADDATADGKTGANNRT